MLSITDLSKNGLNFKRFVFPCKIGQSQGKNKKFELPVNIPEICPICGSKEIRGYIKIFNKGTSKKDDITISIQKTNKFINLNICKDHIYLTEINFKRENIIGLSSVLLVFFLFFFSVHY